MKIIIAGAGKVGGTLAKILTSEGHDITIIDTDSKVIDRISNSVDVIGVVGSATSSDVLKEAGAETADMLIAATEVDEVNMVCGISARKLGTPNVVARVRETEYLKQETFLQETLGLSFIINPEFESAKEISRMLRFPGALKVEEFAKSAAEILEYKVRSESKCDGLQLSKFSESFKAKALVCAVERDGKGIIPRGDFVLKAGDRISIIGSQKELRKLFAGMGEYKKPARDVVIMGGGRIAIYLAQLLQENSINVSIIEHDPERIDAVTDMAPQAKVIYADATKSEVLSEEHIGSADAFVALTGDDSDNIITSLLASRMGVEKIVTKIDSTHYAELIDIDSEVVPKLVIADQIARYVRAISNSSRAGSIESLYRIAESNAEAVEFLVAENSRCIGIPLKDLKLKSNVLVAALVRNGKTMIPDGSTQIAAGDHAVIVTTPGWLMELDAALEGND